MAQVRTFNLIIADDHPIVRFGLKAALTRDSRMRVVAEAGDGREVIRAMSLNKNIDVALVDLAMPRLDGFEVCRQLRSEYPQTRVILMSATGGRETVEKAKKVGAHGFISKQEISESIIRAVKTVTRGQKYFSSSKPRAVTPVVTGPDLAELLTDREKDILRLISKGFKNKEIAAELELSIRTVEFHRANIKGKLQSGNTMELVKTAIQQNLV
ncbi:MAG: response regulator transcription factor [Spirochaetales bacterium]|nr:response regulator transcription factor [Spirochaetales bacterium]